MPAATSPSSPTTLVDRIVGAAGTPRSKMNNEMKKNVLSRNQTIGGSTGPSQPPKNNTVISAEISVTPRYSPTKNMPNFMPEYSE